MNTTHFLNRVAGNLFRTEISPAIPTEYYIGLSTTEPTMSGTNVSEPSTSAGYGRVLLENLSAPVNGVVTNTANINFEESTTSWGTVTHFVIYDAEINGNLLMYGALSTPRVVEAATVMTIRQDYLRLSAQNPA